MSNIRNELRLFMVDLKKQIDSNITNSIATACPLVLNAIFEDRLWNDDTYNLRDSFAWAVFDYGVEVRRGYLEETPKATSDAKKSWTDNRGNTVGLRGREQVDNFLSGYTPRVINGFEVVFVAGMYYANYLQDRNLLLGFINGEEIAKSELLNVLRTNKKPIYVKSANG